MKLQLGNTTNIEAPVVAALKSQFDLIYWQDKTDLNALVQECIKVSKEGTKVGKVLMAMVLILEMKEKGEQVVKQYLENIVNQTNNHSFGLLAQTLRYRKQNIDLSTFTELADKILSSGLEL